MKEWFRVAKKVYGPRHPVVAQHLGDLAAAREGQGEVRRAERSYRQALALTRRLHGPQRPDVATALMQLGAFYHRHARPRRAGGLYRRAIALCEELLGPDHPKMVESLVAYACSCCAGAAATRRPRRWSRVAEVLYDRGPPQPPAAVPANAPSAATPEATGKGDASWQALVEQATAASSAGRRQDAEKSLWAALEAAQMEGISTPAVATVFQHLGVAFLAQGKLAAAEGVLSRSAAMRAELYGVQSPEGVESLYWLAELRRLQGRLDEAARYHEAALAYRQRALSAGDPALAQSFSGTGLVSAAHGDFAQAEAALLHALEGFEQAGAGHGRDAAAVREALAQVRRQAGISGPPGDAGGS